MGEGLPVRISVRVDGAPAATALANETRPDLPKARAAPAGLDEGLPAYPLPQSRLYGKPLPKTNDSDE